MIQLNLLVKSKNVILVKLFNLYSEEYQILSEICSV